MAVAKDIATAAREQRKLGDRAKEFGRLSGEKTKNISEILICVQRRASGNIVTK